MEIGVFKVWGNLICLNKVYIVVMDDLMMFFIDEMVSNWNCSVYEVFVEYFIEGNGVFEFLVIVFNMIGLG